MMSGTPTMTVRQVFSPEDADLFVKVVTDLDSATLDVAVTSDLSQADAAILRVDNSEDADELIRVVAGTIFPSTGPSHLLLDGSPGTFASTPDKPSLDLTGDMDIRIAVALDDWAGEFASFIAKQGGAPEFVSPYQFFRGGDLDSACVAQNVDLNEFCYSSLTSPHSNGVLVGLWMRFIAADSNEGGIASVAFYEKPISSSIALVELDSDEDWGLIVKRLGNNPVVTPLLNNTQSLMLGGLDSGPSLPGKVYAAILRNELGTTVASPDFTAQPPGTTSFEDAQGNLWGLSGNAQIV